MKNNVYHYSYLRVNNAPLLHQARDLALFTNLMTILDKDYRFCDFILNQPKMDEQTKQRCDFNFEANDLLVMSTRPPLHRGGSRPIYRSGHFLEQKILDNVARVFSSLSRDVMYYNETLALKLKRGFENRATIEFYVNRTRKSGSAAGYKNVARFLSGAGRSWEVWSSAAKKRPPTSCGFILYFKTERNVPKTLIVFGMGGEEGLIFSRILRNGLWDKLNIDLSETGASRAIMVEFEVKIPANPISLTFADKMKGKVILDTELE